MTVPGAMARLDRAQLSRYLKRHVRGQLFDDSGSEPKGTAIYGLCDPRDLRLVRYVGQTRAPARRFWQHLNTARLWLPDEPPWWISSPKLRPLYEWIRELYRDELRLPSMVICTWVESPAGARLAERGRICECLQQALPLLNVESERLGRQILLV